MSAIRIYNTLDMTKEQWLKARQEGIGASDIGAIAGLSKWRSAISVYFEKTSKVEEKEESIRLELGKYLEPFVRDKAEGELQKRLGRPMKIIRQNAIFGNTDLPEWARTQIDFKIIDPENPLGDGLLEVKTADRLLAGEWEEGEDGKDGKVPDDYFCQCQWEMGVMGLKYCWLVCLVGGYKLVYVYIPFDEQFFTVLLEIAENFWKNHVLAKEVPPPDGSEATNAVIKKLYPQENAGESVDLSDLYGLLEARAQVIEQLGLLEKQKDKMDQEIKLRMATAEKGYTPVINGHYYDVSYKTQKGRRTIDFDEFAKKEPVLYNQWVTQPTIRVLRILKKEKGGK
jgi:putative phage-type endonuclease